MIEFVRMIVLLSSSLAPRCDQVFAQWFCSGDFANSIRALTARGKKTTVTCTAIARELAAFMWAVAREARPA